MANTPKTKIALQDDVLEQLQSLLFGLRSRFHASLREGEGDGLAPMEARVLQHLAHRPGWTQAELVAHSRRDKAQVTRLIQQLEARGLLVRAPDELDRRKLRLHLTTAGQALQQGLQARRKRLAARLVSDFGVTELQQLGTLLQRMQVNLEDQEAP